MARDPFRNNRALESIAKRIEDGEKEVITKIDPVLIDEHPDNAYLFGMPEEGIESLKRAMIKADGTVACDAPILVWDTGDGRYLAYSGHLRRRAFMEARGNKIPVVIRKLPDEATQRRMLLGANIYGRNINPVNSRDPIHTARQIHYMKVTLAMEGFRGNMREQLAMEFHTSGSTIQRYESFYKLPDHVQEKVQSGELPDTVAQAMGSMETEQIGRAMDALEQLKKTENGAYFTRDNALKVISEAKKEGDVDHVVQDIICENFNSPDDKKEIYENMKTSVGRTVGSAGVKDSDIVKSQVFNIDKMEIEEGEQIVFSNQEEFQSNILDVLQNAEQEDTKIETKPTLAEEKPVRMSKKDICHEQEKLSEEQAGIGQQNLMILDDALNEMEYILTGNGIYPDKGEVIRKLKYLIMLAEKEIERMGSGYENSSI